METFTVTHDHLKLLRMMYVGWQDCEYGAPEINPKRPYGNSDVEGDIAEILGWAYEEDEYYGLPEDLRGEARDLHRQMQTVLQILLCNLHIYPGKYERKDRYSIQWSFVGV